MRLKFLLPLLCLSQASFAQIQSFGDTSIIQHIYYRSVFLCSQHSPLLVEYMLKKSMVACSNPLDRKTFKFRTDPYLDSCTDLDDDYKKSGYDRGHLMSARSNGCSELGMRECFYFSNMFPQKHKLNAGPWLRLEEEERDLAIAYDSIKVFIGGMGSKGTIGKTYHIQIPSYCWKVIYVPKTKVTHYYKFNNSDSLKRDFAWYELKKESEIKAFETELKMTFEKTKVYFSATKIPEFTKPTKK